eukprot:4567025-Heterocapsa_arctica.AAC.1
MLLVGTAEDCKAAVVLTATPLTSEPPEDEGDLLDSALEEIETSAADSQAKIQEAGNNNIAQLQAAK